MKVLYRDTSAYMFLTLGGLISKKIIDKALLKQRKNINYNNYDEKSMHFGNKEKLVENYFFTLLQKELEWTTVERKSDVFAQSNSDKLLIECKVYKPKTFYLDEHTWKDKKMADEELQENMSLLNVTWGCLTDGKTIRLYYSKKLCPELAECYLEFDLENMMKRIKETGEVPEEYFILVDILSPDSIIRKVDPSISDEIPTEFLKKVTKTIKKHGTESVKTVLKTLAVIALEDMGIRPVHKRNFCLIKNCDQKQEYISIFEDVQRHSDDIFHSKDDYITDTLCCDLSKVLKEFSYLDFAHIDHAFLGQIYQKAIKNENASHYTPSYLSKEMALYLAGRSEKTQQNQKKKLNQSLEDDDYIIDPAVGSGQLLRALLPYHKLFFDGTTRGIDGWRKLASHFMARDIDENAVWIAKLSIWLATAKKGHNFIDLTEFKKTDVIEKAINRQALSFKDAFGIPKDKHIASIISNPPWDAFKNDSRRGITYDVNIKEDIEISLRISARQLNRAQIFAKIIHEIATEETIKTGRNVRFAVILPDSFFVDQTQSLRDSLKPSIDMYFSFPRNENPMTGAKVFSDIDNTRKFGIIFGMSKGAFEYPICYPFGNDEKIKLTPELEIIGKYKVLPIFAHSVQAKIKEIWTQKATRFPSWKAGEFDQSLWSNIIDRTEGIGHKIIGGTAFCIQDHAWSQPITAVSSTKMEMSSISQTDIDIKLKSRLLFSDYIQNSAKPNSAMYLKGGLFNVINKIIYSVDNLIHKNDCLIIDSYFYSPFIEAYGTSQNMNAWRLTALGLIDPILSTEPVSAMVEIAKQIKLTATEMYSLYKLSYSWIRVAISPENFCEILSEVQCEGYLETIQEISNDLDKELEKLEKLRQEKLLKRIKIKQSA